MSATATLSITTLMQEQAAALASYVDAVAVTPSERSAAITRIRRQYADLMKYACSRDQHDSFRFGLDEFNSFVAPKTERA